MGFGWPDTPADSGHPVSRKGAPCCTAVTSNGNLPGQSNRVKNMLLNPALVLGVMLLAAGGTACTHHDTSQDPRPDLSRPDVDSSLDAQTCRDDSECNDGLVCTDNRCERNTCMTSPRTDCAWPAEPIQQASNLTGVEGYFWENEFYKDLSGAVWNPETRQLWVCRNTHDDSRIWVLQRDEHGHYAIGSKDAVRGEWADFGDIEGLTLAGFDEPETIYLIVEGRGLIQELDLSRYGSALLKNSWNIVRDLGRGRGAEAITFVPDRFLEEHGFVDAAGRPYRSRGGMGGLMLVGRQYRGYLYAFDLNRKDASYKFVGRYRTGRGEVSGLEFDRSTGQLYIWHGRDYNQLEEARLSSSGDGSERRLDTNRIYNGPGSIKSDNHEGIAIDSTDNCVNGRRSFFLTTDDG